MLQFLGGLGTFLVVSPFVLLAVVAGGWVGTIGVLGASIAIVAVLAASRFRMLGIGIAAGYALATMVSGGICTGWAQL